MVKSCCDKCLDAVNWEIAVYSTSNFGEYDCCICGAKLEHQEGTLVAESFPEHYRQVALARKKSEESHDE